MCVVFLHLRLPPTSCFLLFFSVFISPMPLIAAEVDGLAITRTLPTISPDDTAPGHGPMAWEASSNATGAAAAMEECSKRRDPLVYHAVLSVSTLTCHIGCYFITLPSRGEGPTRSLRF